MALEWLLGKGRMQQLVHLGILAPWGPAPGSIWGWHLLIRHLEDTEVMKLV